MSFKKSLTLLFTISYMTLFLAGCGTTESDKAYDDFKDITLGTSLEDAKKVLGDDYLEIDKNTYQWTYGDGTVTLDVKKNKVVGKSQSNLKTKEVDLKPEMYDKIQPGMTYEEVKKIIGTKGVPSGESKHKDKTVLTYTWSGDSPEKYIQVSFIDDAVVTITKRGLD